MISRFNLGMNAVCRISLGAMADRLGKFNTMFICTFLAGKHKKKTIFAYEIEPNICRYFCHADMAVF